MKIAESKTSKKSFGSVRAYSTNIFNSPSSHNETRMSLVTGMKKFNSKDEEICLFAIYDGYNGNECSTFLRDNLHLYIGRDKAFPADIPVAIRQGLKTAEEEFGKYAKKSFCEGGSSVLVAVVKRTKRLKQRKSCTWGIWGTARLF